MALLPVRAQGVSGGVLALPGVPGEGSGGPEGVPRVGGAGPAPLSGGSEAPVERHFRSDGNFRSVLPVFPPPRAESSGGRKKGSALRSLPPPPLGNPEIPKIPVFIWFYFVFYQNFRAFPAPLTSGSAPSPLKEWGGVPKPPLRSPPGVGEGRKKGGRGRGALVLNPPWTRPPPKIWGGGETPI